MKSKPLGLLMKRSHYIALKTIVHKETTRILRIWSQTLLPPLITQTLYFVIFGKFIGSQIRAINGISYMAFIVPGLVMMAVINSSYANVVSSFFGAKFQRNIEEVLVSPTPDWVIIAGYVLGGVVRGVVVGVLVFLVSLFFVHPVVTHGWAVILFMLLSSMVFSLAALINGLKSVRSRVVFHIRFVYLYLHTTTVWRASSLGRSGPTLAALNSTAPTTPSDWRHPHRPDFAA